MEIKTRANDDSSLIEQVQLLRRVDKLEFNQDLHTSLINQCANRQDKHELKTEQILSTTSKLDKKFDIFLENHKINDGANKKHLGIFIKVVLPIILSLGTLTWSTTNALNDLKSDNEHTQILNHTTGEK